MGCGGIFGGGKGGASQSRSASWLARVPYLSGKGRLAICWAAAKMIACNRTGTPAASRANKPRPTAGPAGCRAAIRQADGQHREGLGNILGDIMRGGAAGRPHGPGGGGGLSDLLRGGLGGLLGAGSRDGSQRRPQ